MSLGFLPLYLNFNIVIKYYGIGLTFSAITEIILILIHIYLYNYD